MAFKTLSQYTSAERMEGKQEARMHLAYRKAMNKPLFNLLPFCTPRDIDPSGVDGAELVKISYIEGLTGAKARKVGVEGTPINVVRKTETVEMEAINSTFQIDRRQIKSTNEFSVTVKDNMDDATLSITDGLLQNLLKGKKSSEWAWNGLDYYFASGNALSGMNLSTPLALNGGVVDGATALKFGSHLRKVINGMGTNKPNTIITTGAGLELIQAYNQVTNVGIKYVKVGDVDYNEFMGLKVCDMPDAYFDETVLAQGIPFYAVRFVADKTGVVIVTKDGNIFDPIAPDMNKHDGRVYEGSNEMVCVPVPCTTECAARCFVNVTDAGE
jgi:hypothetical protein